MSPRPTLPLFALAAFAALSAPAQAASTLSDNFNRQVFCPECQIQPGLIFSEPTEILPPDPAVLREALRRGLDPSDGAIQIVKLKLGETELGLLAKHGAGRGGGRSWELAGLVDLDRDGLLDYAWGTLSARGKKFSASLNLDASVTTASAAAAEVDATLSLSGRTGKDEIPTEISEATLSRGGRSEALRGGAVELSD